jgi:hypothetical protein
VSANKDTAARQRLENVVGARVRNADKRRATRIEQGLNYMVSQTITRDGPAVQEALDFIERKNPTARDLLIRFSLTDAGLRLRIKACGDRIVLKGERYELASPAAEVKP